MGIQGDFESAITATVCLKVGNYSFSGSRIEGLNFSQRLPQSQYGVMPVSEANSITKTI